MKRAISEYTFYRSRYLIGIIIGSIIVAALLIGAAIYIPGGLRAGEMASAVVSSTLSFHYISPDAIINLPYHILQHLSFSLFSVTLLSIKLPSLIFAFGIVVGLFLLVNTWFRMSTALIATVIATTMPFFLFAAQDGTPLLYTVFLSTWLLVTGTYTSRSKRPRLLWKTIFIVLFALNLYAPLGIYLDAALLSTMLFHPHIRHLIRSLNKAKTSLGLFLGCIALIPLIYAITSNPSIIKPLLGWPTAGFNLVANAHTAGTLLFGFQGGTFNGLVAPVLPIGISLLLIVGIYYFVRVKYTAQSYIISIWTLFLVPLVIIDPSRVPYLFVIIVLLIATAIHGLTKSWYSIFPNNPYAHIVALVPLGFVVSGLFASSLMQYTSAYYYDHQVVASFSGDLKILPKALASVNASKTQQATVLTTSDELPFYSVVAKYRKDFVATDTVPVTPPNRLVVTHDATTSTKSPLPSQLALVRILTNRLSSDSDRFYTYTSTQK